jgi:hypothetical protein
MDWFGVKRVLAVTSAELRGSAKNLRDLAGDEPMEIGSRLEEVARSLEDKALVLSTLDAVIVGLESLVDRKREGAPAGFMEPMPGMSPAERVQQLENAEPEPEEDSPEARGEGLLRQMRRTSPPEE